MAPKLYSDTISVTTVTAATQAVETLPCSRLGWYVNNHLRRDNTQTLKPDLRLATASPTRSSAGIERRVPDRIPASTLVSSPTSTNSAHQGCVKGAGYPAPRLRKAFRGRSPPPHRLPLALASNQPALCLGGAGRFPDSLTALNRNVLQSRRHVVACRGAVFQISLHGGGFGREL